MPRHHVLLEEPEYFQSGRSRDFSVNPKSSNKNLQGQVDVDERLAVKRPKNSQSPTIPRNSCLLYESLWSKLPSEIVHRIAYFSQPETVGKWLRVSRVHNKLMSRSVSQRSLFQDIFVKFSTTLLSQVEINLGDESCCTKRVEFQLNSKWSIVDLKFLNQSWKNFYELPHNSEKLALVVASILHRASFKKIEILANYKEDLLQIQKALDGHTFEELNFRCDSSSFPRQRNAFFDATDLVSFVQQLRVQRLQLVEPYEQYKRIPIDPETFFSTATLKELKVLDLTKNSILPTRKYILEARFKELAIRTEDPHRSGLPAIDAVIELIKRWRKGFREDFERIAITMNSLDAPQLRTYFLDNLPWDLKERRRKSRFYKEPLRMKSLNGQKLMLVIDDPSVPPWDNYGASIFKRFLFTIS